MKGGALGGGRDAALLAANYRHLGHFPVQGSLLSKQQSPRSDGNAGGLYHGALRGRRCHCLDLPSPLRLLRPITVSSTATSCSRFKASILPSPHPLRDDIASNPPKTPSPDPSTDPTYSEPGTPKIHGNPGWTFLHNRQESVLKHFR